jgi:hypothetical protein
MVFALSTNDGTGKPVPNAVITFAKNGAVFNQLSFPNNTGVLYIDNIADANLLQGDVQVRVKAPGYNDAGTNGSSITGDWEFTLKPNGLGAAAVIGVGIGLVLLYVAMDAKTKKR